MFGNVYILSVDLRQRMSDDVVDVELNRRPQYSVSRRVYCMW